MVKIFAAALLAISMSAGAAIAHGGGAEPMPGMSFTDLPSYHPQPLESHKIKRARNHARWHQGTARDR